MEMGQGSDHVVQITIIVDMRIDNSCTPASASLMTTNTQIMKRNCRNSTDKKSIMDSGKTCRDAFLCPEI